MQLKLSVEAVEEELSFLCREGFLCRLEAYDTAYYYLPARWKSAAQPLSAGGNLTVLPQPCPSLLPDKIKAAGRVKNNKDALLELLSLKCLEGDSFCLHLFSLAGLKKVNGYRPDAAFLRQLEREVQSALPADTRLFWPEEGVLAFITGGGTGEMPAAAKEAAARIEGFLLGGEPKHAASRFPQDGETALEIYYCAAGRLKKAVEKN